MRILAIVQARLGSRRLPGKVLRTIGEAPLLDHLLERLQRCGGLEDIVVATSRHRTDDPLVEHCRVRGVRCVRGPHADVTSRFLQVVRAFRPDAFLRACGDSPLLDRGLVEQAISLFRRGDYEVVTNAWPRTFPSGQSVEVVRRDAFERAVERMTDSLDREHVTRFFYRNPDAFRIRSITAAADLSHVRLAVDTEQDLEHIASLVSQMTGDQWQYGLNDILQLARGVPALV
jgi:spore coat polysaccharide biosynthesis protein SpsF (cytidylyltransferase family)